MQPSARARALIHGLMLEVRHLQLEKLGLMGVVLLLPSATSG